MDDLEAAAYVDSRIVQPKKLRNQSGKNGDWENGSQLHEES
jgi:hypothetical protein